MTDEDTRPYAKHGKVHIPGWGDDDTELAVTEASELIGDIAIAIKDARRQLAAITEACAAGHDWDSGYNANLTAADDAKTTVYHCTRQGCDGRKEEPGWLPFEPKQHLVPYSSKLWDCTGPGCEHCDNERLADSFSKFATDALHRLAPDLSALTAAVDTTPLLRGEPTPDRWASIVPKKLGYTWAIDATPEQVQAALDARDQTRNAP